MGQFDIEQILAILRSPAQPPAWPGSSRYARNIARFKTGRPPVLAEIARDLAEVARHGRLIVGEERMFNRCVRLLAGRWNYESGLPYETARSRILDALR